MEVRKRGAEGAFVSGSSLPFHDERPSIGPPTSFPSTSPLSSGCWNHTTTTAFRQRLALKARFRHSRSVSNFQFPIFQSLHCCDHFCGRPVSAISARSSLLVSARPVCPSRHLGCQSRHPGCQSLPQLSYHRDVSGPRHWPQPARLATLRCSNHRTSSFSRPCSACPRVDHAAWKLSAAADGVSLTPGGFCHETCASIVEMGCKKALPPLCGTSGTLPRASPVCCRCRRCVLCFCQRPRTRLPAVPYPRFPACVGIPAPFRECALVR